MASSTSIKGPAPAPASFPGAEHLRIGIVHARWNTECIDPLVQGCVQSLTKAGVKQENIVIESVPGSWELPMGTSRWVLLKNEVQRSLADNSVSSDCLLHYQTHCCLADPSIFQRQ
jgi:6,7-dimethyl-8-ribityllumazine synthase